MGCLSMSLLDCLIEGCADTPKACYINVSTGFDECLHHFSVVHLGRQMQGCSAKKHIFCVNISALGD